MAKVNLKDAVQIDFSGTVSGFHQHQSYDEQIVSLIRKSNAPRTVIVIDRGFALPKMVPYLVRDHLNLTGFNPLIGPNDPCGERFPAVNGIYITDALSELPQGIAAGLKPGIKPTDSELKQIKSLGADFYCYNLIPTLLVAAHARKRVLAIVLPEGIKLDPMILQTITS